MEQPSAVSIIVATGLVTAVPLLIVAILKIREDRNKAMLERKHEESMAMRTELVKLRLDAGSRLIDQINELYLILSPTGLGALIYTRESQDNSDIREQIDAVDEKLEQLQPMRTGGELFLGPETMLAYYAFTGAYDRIRFKAFTMAVQGNACHQVMVDLMNDATNFFTSALAKDLESASIVSPTMSQLWSARIAAQDSAEAKIEDYMKETTSA